MKKINKLWFILHLIFIVLFNAIFFLAGKDYKASAWISYGCIHLAYGMLVITPLFTKNTKSKAMFGLSLYAISSAYFLLQLVIGVVLIIISLKLNATILIQLCLAGFYGIALVSFLMINERTAAAEETRQIEISFIKEATQKVKNLLTQINNKELNLQVEKIYDTLQASPTKSHPELALIERKISLAIEELEIAIAENDEITDIARNLLNTINDRNSKLKGLQQRT